MFQVRYSRRSPQWQLTGSNLTVQYYLGEMVLRLGSKHLLGGLRFPLEIQLIHYNAKYKNLQEAMSQLDGVVVVVKFFQVRFTLLLTFLVFKYVILQIRSVFSVSTKTHNNDVIFIFLLVHERISKI